MLALIHSDSSTAHQLISKPALTIRCSNRMRWAFSKGMEHVDVAKALGNRRNQPRAFPALEPVGLCHFPEDLACFGFDALGVAEVRVALGDIHATKLPRPVVNIAKQGSVDMLQVVQPVGRRLKIELAGSQLGKLALGTR